MCRAKIESADRRNIRTQEWTQFLKHLKLVTLAIFVVQTYKLLARSSRQEAAAEGRIDSRACVVNMCVLGEKSCFVKISVFHLIDFSVFHSFQVRFLSISFNPL